MPQITLPIDINWITLLATVILPMLTALVTARLAHPGLKAGVLALLALATSTANELLAANAISVTPDFSSILSTALIVFLGSVGMHYGLLKPVSLTGGDGAIQRSIPSGLGSQVRTAEDEAFGPR